PHRTQGRACGQRGPDRSAVAAGHHDAGRRDPVPLPRPVGGGEPRRLRVGRHVDVQYQVGGHASVRSFSGSARSAALSWSGGGSWAGAGSVGGGGPAEGPGSVAGGGPSEGAGPVAGGGPSEGADPAAAGSSGGGGSATAGSGSRRCSASRRRRPSRSSVSRSS